MSLSQMTFDRVWTNPVDFPTHETQESTVRADIQYLFDSIKNQYNNFITNEFTAENMSFAPTETILSTNVQAAIEFLMSEIQGLVLSELVLPDGSVITSKLANEAVTSEKIGIGAVETANIKDGAVTADKIADGALSGSSFADNSIPAGKLGAASVDTSNLVNNCVTAGKLANEAVTEQRLAAEAVVTTKIKDLNVTTAKIANAAVTKDKLAGLSVITDKINTGAVTTAKLADGSITTAKIIDGNVTEAKLATDLNNKINGKQEQHKTATTTLESGYTTWTKSVTGVTATNDVDVTHAEDDDSWEQWCNCGIRCSGQASGQLTFKARSAPSHDVVVNIKIWD